MPVSMGEKVRRIVEKDCTRAKQERERKREERERKRMRNSETRRDR